MQPQSSPLTKMKTRLSEPTVMELYDHASGKKELNMASATRLLPRKQLSNERLRNSIQRNIVHSVSSILSPLFHLEHRKLVRGMNLELLKASSKCAIIRIGYI